MNVFACKTYFGCLNKKLKKDLEEIKVYFLGLNGVGAKTFKEKLYYGKIRSVYQLESSLKEVWYKDMSLVENGNIFRFSVLKQTGQETFRSLEDQFIRMADVIVVTFSYEDLSSFEEIENYLLRVFRMYEEEHEDGTLPIIVVGNKKDLVNKYCVDVESVLQFCKNMAVPYIDTSAKENINLDLLWNTIMTEYFVKTVWKRRIIESSVKLES